MFSVWDASRSPIRAAAQQQVIGPEIGPCFVYNVIGHSVQITQVDDVPDKRWMVAALWSGCRVDLRFPIEHFRSRWAAMERGLVYARHHVGPGHQLEPWPGGDWLLRSATNPSLTTTVMTVRLSR